MPHLESEMYLKSILDLKYELRIALKKPKHPWKLMSLATCGANGQASTRMVVVRKIEDDPFAVVFYTDRRSKKVEDFTHSDTCELLFWDARNSRQLRLRCQVVLDYKSEEFLRDLNERQCRDYATLVPPGQPIQDQKKAYHHDVKTEAKRNFCAVQCLPFEVDYLELKEPEHQRMKYLLDKRIWKEICIAP